MQTMIKENQVPSDSGAPDDRDTLLQEAKKIIHSLSDHQKRELLKIIKTDLMQN